MARDFLGNITGPQGSKGDDGARGPQGPQGESEPPYIVDSGEKIDDTGSHFYEIYSTGKGKAWGYHILNNVDFDVPLGDFHRYTGSFKIDGLIHFEDDTASGQIFIDNRTNIVNCFAMTTVDNGAYDNIRLMVLNPSPQLGVTVYITYTHIGVPI